MRTVYWHGCSAAGSRWIAAGSRWIAAGSRWIAAGGGGTHSSRCRTALPRIELSIPVTVQAISQDINTRVASHPYDATRYGAGARRTEACAIRVPHEAAGRFGGDGEDGTGRTGGGDVGGLFEGVLMPRSDEIGPAMWEGPPTLGLGF